MNLQEIQSRISYLMSIFVTQVKGETAMGKTDINRLSENVLVRLFKEVYGYKALKNLNLDEDNYPAIDLGDEAERVCFQITSTSDIDKVKNTLQKFVEHKLYNKYDKLIIYIISEKQKSYTSKSLKDICQGKFEFDVKNDIQDYSDILKIVASFPVGKADKIRKILEDNFGEGKSFLYHEAKEDQNERLHLNLIKISFPKTLYIASLSTKLKAIRSNLNQPSRTKKFSKREPVQDALASLGIRFGVDWEYFENRLITFHDLRNSDLALSKIVDKETIIEIDAKSFCDKSSDNEKVFKSLLRKCLQQKLFQRKVKWQHEEKLFIFCDIDGESERKESWKGERVSSREVYTRIVKKDKPHETFYCRHLAFKAQYKKFGDNWYILVKPEWFFSYDGYKKSFYSEEKVDWLKKKENNSQVFNHFRFIAYFLSNNEPLQISRRTYPFLSFGNIENFNSTLILDDQEWNPPKDSEEDSEDIDLPLFKS
ncbi:hypothetical protein B9G53_07685 [Pseudanabaena sp. SR411]|uniref:SMEK domain-containing protein n=1 Tax=Pseudanabaena sp. SR411 TaxID=1980935 RepID=UPI000BCA3995|nr:SMEK domain-containing protein [Pseudanabaena sp. SR411]OYQ65279.1 hypothetical protein B9G53_07685 [Pseudanabaena sp. SR411]